MISSDNFPVNELLDVFQRVDKKISELHNNSSSVFLQLNSFLKDYFSKNNIVSSNAVKIFDTITGNEGNSMNSELNEIFMELQNFREENDMELRMNLNLYYQLICRIDNLSILFRNFKQDFITLKFIIANYRVIPYTGTAKNRRINVPLLLEGTISEIYPWLSKSADDIASLSRTLSSLNAKTKIYLNNSGTSNSGLYEDLKGSINLINDKNIESKNHIPVLKSKINSSSDSIGNIIKHLQYHDIIRQKIEHIQKSHQKITNDIRTDSENENINGNKNSEFITRISDISGLQAAQLILISKEYQKALEVISENFQKIADDLTVISTISHEFSYESENSEINLINLLKERLDKSLLILDENGSNSFNQVLVQVSSQVNHINNILCNNIFQPLDTLNNLVQVLSASVTNKSVSGDREMTIEEQLSALTGEIIGKRNILKKELAEITEITEKFPVVSVPDGFRSKLEKEQIRIMVNISRILGKLDDESKLLDNVLMQNYTIRRDIIDRLKEVLNKADYYELFEKVLNSIIEQLNEVNAKLKVEGNDSSSRSKNLKEIEDYYTVASERLIHHKVINEGIAELMPSETENSEELELF